VKGPDCSTSTYLIQLGLLYCYKAQTWPKPEAGKRFAGCHCLPSDLGPLR
jgi:hypothetical protein